MMNNELYKLKKFQLLQLSGSISQETAHKMKEPITQMRENDKLDIFLLNKAWSRRRDREFVTLDEAITLWNNST